MSTSLAAKTNFLRNDLRRRATALKAILSDIGMSENEPFRDAVLVVDWSEIHSYICGSGPPRSDYLFELSTDAERVNGAHQAALSFLFEVFPSPLLVLPPHVRELMWFVEAAQQFADLREVDEQLLQALSGKLDHDVVHRVRKVHSQWQREHPGQTLSDVDLRQVFGNLGDQDSSTLRSCLAQQFAPMFLLGRWLTIDALRDLQRLLDRNSTRRVLFLKDYHPELSQTLSESTQNIERWHIELNPRATKSKNLADNDARALAYLQILNCDLHARLSKQLLFVTRSDDLLGAIENRPEWFSCLGDAYGMGDAAEVPIDGSSPISVVRDWIYFFELGAAWRPGANLRVEIECRLDSVRAMLASLPTDGLSHGARQTLASYFEKEAGLLDNIQALSSAQNAKFRPERRRHDVSVDRSLIDFLRFVTNPNDFVTERSKLQDEMKELIDRINAVLPPLPSALRSSRYRPVVRAVLDVLTPEWLVRDISATDLRQSAVELLALIKEDRHTIGATSDLARQLNALTTTARTKEPAALLIYSLHAYLYRAHSKARALILPHHGRQLPGVAQVLRLLLIADYWLLEHERLRKVDEVMAEILQLDHLGRNTVLRLTILNARVQLELEASYEHDEDPASFRRTATGERGCLQVYWEALLDFFESCETTRIPRPLHQSVLDNLTHASARLTVIEDCPDEPDFESGGRPETARPLVTAERYVRQLEEWCTEVDDIESKHEIAMASSHDALGYYNFKKACLVQQALAFSRHADHDGYRQKAETHLRQAKELIDRHPVEADAANRRALVVAHLELCERLSR